MLLPKYLPAVDDRLREDGKKVRISRNLALLVTAFWALLSVQAGGVGVPEHKRLWSGNTSALQRGSVSAADICVVGGDLGRLNPHTKSPGQQWLWRVNVTALNGEEAVQKAIAAGAPLVASVREGSLPRLEVGADGWTDFVIQHLLTPALVQGCDGWVLEGLDNVSMHSHAKQLITALRKALPDKAIFLIDGLSYAEKDSGTVGVYLEGPANQLLKDGKRIAAVVAGGSKVLACAYGDPAQVQANEAAATDLIALGATAFVTVDDQSGFSLAPLRERSRRVLVLYGWDSKETGKPAMLPVDTMTGELLQTPMEWLGYEADFASVAKELPANAAARWAAIVIDGETDIPGARELTVARWLAQVRKSGVPVLFTGGLPFSDEEALNLIRDAFDLRGSLQPARNLRDLTVGSQDSEVMNLEMPAKPQAAGFMDLQAPEKSQVLLSLSARREGGDPVRFTPVFIAPWGGMWLEPYVVFRASQDSCLFHADPYRILARVLEGRGTMPAPDTTTRDGRRIFYSHIDGDGFASLSSFRGHPNCAEVVRDRILKVFQVPVTVSIIESEIRALADGIEDASKSKLAATAQSIFALPHVQAASHSFSHPYLWWKDDPNPGVYTEANLKLKPEAGYPDIQMEREIRGSVDYINRELLPPSKRVEIFLWTGNCRPGEQALQTLRELKLENMNGGDTIVSRLYPGIGGVAPRVTPWGDELQINAANQNEFMYANGWNGPFYGGFANVIDTFERTEGPRRLKPVNVYYHFYSAMNLSSVRALEKIYRWCESQPLHPVTALQFAQITRDAWRTRIFDLGPRRWLLVNDGHLRTYRLPTAAGVPDMVASKGITGWTEHSGSIYVHTDGRRNAELQLTDPLPGAPEAKAAHLYLTGSQTELEFQELSPWKASFTAKGNLTASPVEFAGLPAKTSCDVTINGHLTTLVTDDQGHLRLSVPPNANVILDASRSRYASLR